MVNLQINGAKLAEDTEIAKKIIEGKFELLGLTPKRFHSYSRVYVTTNENLSHNIIKKSFMDRKRVLSITASGDQLLNSILYGGEDITGIDITVFAKYYVALKIAAIETLNQQEYLSYFGFGNLQKFLNKKYYKKIRNNLVEEARAFWDEIFGRYSGNEIYRSSLVIDARFPSTMIENNPYLQDYNYGVLKRNLKNAKIELFDKDITKLTESDFGEFDLIFLSNVLDYLCDVQEAEEGKGKAYKDFFKGLPLKDDGLALAYNLLVRLDLARYLKGVNFKAYNRGEIITYQNKIKRFGLFRKKK